MPKKKRSALDKYLSKNPVEDPGNVPLSLDEMLEISGPGHAADRPSSAALNASLGRLPGAASAGSTNAPVPPSPITPSSTPSPTTGGGGVGVPSPGGGGGKMRGLMRALKIGGKVVGPLFGVLTVIQLLEMLHDQTAGSAQRKRGTDLDAFSDMTGGVGAQLGGENEMSRQLQGIESGRRKAGIAGAVTQQQEMGDLAELIGGQQQALDSMSMKDDSLSLQDLLHEARSLMG